MTPQQFMQKWQASSLTERSAAQSHFIDLCALLQHPTPAEADPDGNWFTFEKGTTKTGGGKGWADVWKHRHFAWEYKGKHKDLDRALVQLQQYAVALENPPLLVVSDMNIIRIHTNFTNTVQEIHLITLDELTDPAKLQLLRQVFNHPEQLKPDKTRNAVTNDIAQRFAALAERLRKRGHKPLRVAHFVSKLLFCMFAEDAGLYKGGKHIFTEILEACRDYPEHCGGSLRGLFAAMSKGGIFGTLPIDHFNGGLFDNDDILPLEPEDIRDLLNAAYQDWQNIEPSIFGTLFERGLDPDKRSQLGAHYTDPESIMRIVKPVVLQPLENAWQLAKSDIENVLQASRAKKSIPKKARDIYSRFMQQLADVRILDPACGSGNFLYLALRGLKDLEHKAGLEAEALGIPRQFSINAGPHNVYGIELNPYAAELARVTIWIGHIQWMLKNGYDIKRDPVLDRLDQIQCRDAIITDKGVQPRWPEVDFIIGNPPFLGDKKMLDGLGEAYVTDLRKLYQGKVPGGADLVTYWFEKARDQLSRGRAKAVGLVSTNSIRGGANRKVLERIRDTGRIFNAWSDEPWVNEGAAVRVSIVCFAAASANHQTSTAAESRLSQSGDQHSPWWLNGLFGQIKQIGEPAEALLNGEVVEEIYADLTGAVAQGLNLAAAKLLMENKGVSFIGTQKNGPFDIAGDLARKWLQLPTNPNGRPNSDVLRPWANGMDITRRPSDSWIIDFGVDMLEEDAALYEKPFEHVVSEVKPKRVGKREERANLKWWIHQRARPEMRKALTNFNRFIGTARVSKHRCFIWFDKIALPDTRVVIIAREDDTAFGILHSRIHEVWSLATCSWHGVGNDPTYNAKSVFETFPFPAGLSPNIPAADYADNPHAQAIATAAQRLNQLRNNWLNPPEWVKRLPEVVTGYPDRILPVDDNAAKELKKRTLTNLYNQRPAWLANAHKQLDTAVAAAYGWEADLSDDEMLRRLLALNLERSAYF